MSYQLAEGLAPLKPLGRSYRISPPQAQCLSTAALGASLPASQLPSLPRPQALILTPIAALGASSAISYQLSAVSHQLFRLKRSDPQAPRAILTPIAAEGESLSPPQAPASQPPSLKHPSSRRPWRALPPSLQQPQAPLPKAKRSYSPKGTILTPIAALGASFQPPAAAGPAIFPGDRIPSKKRCPGSPPHLWL
jgi:hypothetical protein